MAIRVRQVDGRFHFVGLDTEGREVHIDTSSDEGGSGRGISPLQLVIVSLGGCSGVDVASILMKARQPPDALELTLEAEREDRPFAAKYTHIHVHYDLEGALEPARVRRAIELSLGKYCTVARILRESGAAISYSFSVNGDRYEELDRREAA